MIILLIVFSTHYTEYAIEIYVQDGLYTVAQLESIRIYKGK